MRYEETPQLDERWGVILAGGEGSRLRPLTRRIIGDERPKQFCPILRGETLLERTRRRTALAVPPDRTLLVVTLTHEPFYTHLLKDAASHCLVVQPQNQGTTPAILYSLLRMTAMAPRGFVAIFPSDHYVSNDRTFMAHVEAAFEAVCARPDLIILLGIHPASSEVEYGWIEPAEPIRVPSGYTFFRVHRFWEKPSFTHAQTLLAGGSLWNSFVMVGGVAALLSLVKNNVPELYQAFRRVQPTLNTPGEARAIQALYRQLPSSNFSQEVLATCPPNLAVLPVRGVEWSDWGDPARVLACLAHIGILPEWAPAPLAASA